MAFCCQLLLLPCPAKSRYAVLLPLLDQRQWRWSSHGGLRWWLWYQQQWWQWRWQRCNPLPCCCRNPPPLHVSSLLASSFPFSLMPVAVAMCQNNIVQSAGTTRDPTQNLGCAFHLFLVPDWPHFLESSDF